MVLTPVSLSEASRAIVTEYDASTVKSGAHWSMKEVNAVRQEIKAHYIEAQQHLCCYCGIPDPANHHWDWDAEHIVPKALHPEFLFTAENLSVACRECNQAKRSKETLVDPTVSIYPVSSDAFLVVHPHFDEWSEHILRDNLTYASLSAKGAWTIKECNLNRFDGRVIGLRYPISDRRWEQPVRELLSGEMTLQEVIDFIVSQERP